MYSDPQSCPDCGQRCFGECSIVPSTLPGGSQTDPPVSKCKLDTGLWAIYHRGKLLGIAQKGSLYDQREWTFHQWTNRYGGMDLEWNSSTHATLAHLCRQVAS